VELQWVLLEKVGKGWKESRESGDECTPTSVARFRLAVHVKVSNRTV